MGGSVGVGSATIIRPLSDLCRTSGWQLVGCGALNSFRRVVMAIDKGDCVDRAARGMFVAALALACGACGGGRHHQEPTAGNANAGGNAGVAGRASLGGSTGSAASANSGGEVA